MRTLVQNKYIHIVQGGLGGNSPRNQRYVKMEDFPFLPEILHTRRIDSPVMMWIQIRARVGGGLGGMLSRIFFLNKMVQSGAF